MSAQRTYSLAEIRAVDCLAWKEDYLYAHRELLRIVVLPDRSGANHTRIRRTALRVDDQLLADGWMHLPNCACRLCSN